MPTKVTNEVKMPHDIEMLSDLSEGATFLYRGELAILTDKDPEIMYLGGMGHGQKEELEYSEAEVASVMLVNCEITWSRIPAPRAKKVKKAKKAKKAAKKK